MLYNNNGAGEGLEYYFTLSFWYEFEYEEDNSDEEIQDIIEIIESMVEDSSLLSNTSTEVSEVMENSDNLENSNQSFVIEIKHYKTILLEKKTVVRKKELQKLRFPQLMVAYYFDYTTEKKILYSVLSSATAKLEVPKDQMKIGIKEIKPMAKRAIIHKKINLKTWLQEEEFYY